MKRLQVSMDGKTWTNYSGTASGVQQWNYHRWVDYEPIAPAPRVPKVGEMRTFTRAGYPLLVESKPPVICERAWMTAQIERSQPSAVASTKARESWVDSLSVDWWLPDA